MKTETKIRFPWGLALLVTSLWATGCGGGGEQYDVVPVSGVVTCQGEPVVGGVVNFTPQPAKDKDRAAGRPGRVALGVTDENGRFELTTYENGDGAIIGRHTVTVGLRDENAEDRRNPNRGFPCLGVKKEITVEPDMEEVRLEF